ncbi:hypothetical protein [Neisseria chenwenguii]|uniref:hypothetical protein n=1 Tax=Neisseria chenwenguii TaxID=1853278 RepID=UPI000F4EA290|nr:hypothetical protein [Neisseria chenwenguii]
MAQQVADGSQDSMREFQQQLEDLKKQMLDFSQFAALIKKDLNKTIAFYFDENWCFVWRGFDCGDWFCAVVGFLL